MKGVIIFFISIMLFLFTLLITLLLGHVISYAFGMGWALSGDNKGACAVIGCILGVIACICYWSSMDDDGN